MVSALDLCRFAWRLFRRDWRRKDLLLLIFALTVAMASISVIYLLVDKIERATDRQMSDILGADLVISSPREISSEWLQRGQDLHLTQATSVEFSSVLFAHEKMQLSSVKAVSDNYPLKSYLEIADAPYQAARRVNRAPPAGQLWLEPNLFSSLALGAGDRVEVGYSELSVAGALMRQPSQGATLFNLAPTAIINQKDLAATRILQPGSRVTYRYYFIGDQQAVAEFTAWIKPQLISSQRLAGVYDESPVAASAIERSKKYIALSSLLTLILLGVTIAMSASRYARRQFDMMALMRCFGLNHRQVLFIFTQIILCVALVGIFIGALIGLGVQALTSDLLSQWLSQTLPDGRPSVLWAPALASVLLLFGFATPALTMTKNVPPMRVLRRQLQPAGLNTWLSYLVAVLSFILVLWLQIHDLKLLMSVVMGLIGVGLIFAVLAIFLLKLLKRMAISRSASVNFSLRQLDANRGVTLLHLMAFSFTLFVIALMILVRSELLAKWQQSLGDNTPNQFLVNVKPSEIDALHQFFQNNQLEVAELYPMVRGRIVGINGNDVKAVVSESGLSHNSLQRELNITWTDILPMGNQITEGTWQWPLDSARAPISLDVTTAKALGLKLGDVINFTIGADKWDGQIVSLRSIDWQTFTPNFYVITKPGSLANYPATYIGSFYLPLERNGMLVNLVKNFPGVTLIDLGRIFQQVQSIIDKVTVAVQVIMLFVVAAGMALLWATMSHTFDAKYKQSAILRTLGAQKQFLSRSFRFEYVWLAILSSAMAICAVESIAFALYHWVFKIDFSLHWILWICLPIATLVFMLLASWRGVRQVTQPSPLYLLRQS